MSAGKSVGLIVLVALACSEGAGERGGAGAAPGAGGASSVTPMAGAGGSGGTGAAGAGGAADGGVSAITAVVSVDTTERVPRTSTWSVSYWTWSPSYGDPLPGTEPAIRELSPALLRIGAYNNDANLPDPFDAAELDDAIAYARAIGAEPLLQIPLLARADGARPTPEDAAQMLTYANVTQGYGIRYVSIGNEPDLYPDQGGLTNPAAPAIAGYTPEQYCMEIRPIALALEGVDPALQLVGPDLGYKYQSFADWLTPILQGCGDLFDVIAVHRYPFEALQATPEDIAADPLKLPAWAADLRARMVAAGVGDKPLALTEMNLAYVASPVGYTNGSILGTVPHALWVADIFGQAALLGLWTTAHFDIADPDEFALGLVGLPPEHRLRPAYHALLLYARHTGPTLVRATTDRSELRAYATRNSDDSATQIVLTNWASEAIGLRVEVLDGASPSSTSVVVPALSVSAIDVPERSAPSAWTYGATQEAEGGGIEALPLEP